MKPTPIRTSHRVRLGVGIYGCRRPFYFASWCAAAPFLPRGLPIKRSPRVWIPWEKSVDSRCLLFQTGQRKTFLRSRLIARQCWQSAGNPYAVVRQTSKSRRSPTCAGITHSARYRRVSMIRVTRDTGKWKSRIRHGSADSRGIDGPLNNGKRPRSWYLSRPDDAPLAT